MANIVVVIDSLTEVTAPAGTVAGLFRFSIYSVAGEKLFEQDVAETTATFTNVPSGTYSVLAARLDANGVQIGGSTGVSFEVPAEDVLVSVPATITVSLA